MAVITAVTDSPEVLALAAPFTLPCGIVAPNRLCKAAMEELLGPLGGGDPSPLHFKLYEDWARGSWGIILTGNVMISSTDLGSPRDIVLPTSDPTSASYRTSIAAFTAWAAASHVPFLGSDKKSAVVIMQLCHPGRQSMRGSGRHWATPCKAPSAVALNSNKGLIEKVAGKLLWGTPEAMTQAHIDDVIAGFVRGARVAKESGFEGVQLHCSHGYLLAQFFSPNVNLRTDKYGGSPRARMTLLLEIIDAIRKEFPLGSGFCLGLKLNSSDYVAGGLTETDALDNVKWIAEHGGVDFIEISGGTYENAEMLKDDNESVAAQSKTPSENLKPSARTHAREAFFISFASSARAMLLSLPAGSVSGGIPAIMVTGGFRTRSGMASALTSSSTDFVGVGRPACVDPALPVKLLDSTIPSEEARSPRYTIRGASMLKWIPLGVVNAGAGTIWHSLVLALVARGDTIDEDVLKMSLFGGAWRVWLRDAVKRNAVTILVLFSLLCTIANRVLS